METVKQSTRIILFIDELQMIMNGGGDGNVNISNILKPALAGENCMSSGQRPWMIIARALKKMRLWSGGSSRFAWMRLTWLLPSIS
jgi:hypothetical protein